MTGVDLAGREGGGAPRVIVLGRLRCSDPTSNFHG